MAEYTSFRVGVDPNVEGGNILYIGGWVKEIEIDGTLQYSNSSGNYISNNYTVTNGQEIRIKGEFNLQNSTISSIDNFVLQNGLTSVYRMFKYCESLTSITFHNNIDTSNVTNMREMFYGCESLTSLDLSNFNTSNVTTMRAMFSECRSLISLDVSRFNTSNVTDMCAMFSNCRSLTSLDVSRFNTENVTDMSGMFHCLFEITSLDVSNFNTSQVTDMALMFAGNRNLTSLDLSSFNTSNVTNMREMFANCNNLETINLSSFNLTNTTEMNLMFWGCIKLTSIPQEFVDKFIAYPNSIGNACYEGCNSLVTLGNTTYNTNVEAMATIPVYWRIYSEEPENPDPNPPTPPEPTTYNVTYYLTDCTCGGPSQVTSNTIYSFNLIVLTRYELQSVTVEMGGVDITDTAYNSETQEVTLQYPTGDVIITAIAVRVEPEPDTYNITYNLTNCNYNGQTGEIIITVNAGGEHTATIYPNDGYDKVKIAKMGSYVDNGLEFTENDDGSITFNFTSLTGDISIGLHGEIIYTVTYNLTDCYSTNTNGQIEYDPIIPTNPSYSTAIYPNSNYTLDTIRVEMGGEEFSNYVFGDNYVDIDISEVTGDIIITATAKQSGTEPGPNPTGSPTGGPTGPMGPTGEHNCDPENCKCILVGKNYTTTITVGNLPAGTEIKATDKIHDILERILTGTITPSFKNPTLSATLNETVNTTINTDVLFTVDISIILNDAEGPYNIKATVNGKEVYNNNYTEGQTSLNCALLAKDNTSIGNFPVKVTLTYYRYGIETSITVVTSNKVNIENDGSVPEFLIGKCNNYGAKYPSQFTAAKMNEMISAGNLEWTTNLYSGKEYTLGNRWDIIAFVPVSYLTSQGKNEVDELLRFMGWDDIANNYVEVYPDETDYCRGNAILTDRFGKQIEFRYCAYKSLIIGNCNYKMVRR